MLVVVISGSLLLQAQSAPASGAAKPVNEIRMGTLLTNTALGGYSQLDQIDMLSPSLGYALATRYLGKGRYRYFLVRTTDLARTWRVVSEIPSDAERFPIFTDFDTDDSDPSIDFTNQEVGYVDGPGGSIEVTDNGGLTWRSISARNASSSYGVSGSTTSVVTATCTTPAGSASLKCRDVISEFAVGSITPESSRPIPTHGVNHGESVGLLSALPGPIQIVDLSNNQFSTASSLLITRDDGLTWHGLSNPCSSSMILQLVVANDGDWLLSCFRDGGMYHGTAQIFRTSDQGLTWSTVLDDTAQRNVVGNLGGTPAYLFFNGNDRILYAAMMNPAGGLMTSTDGGTNWSPDTAFGNTGGSPGSITNFGLTSSIYQVFQGIVYVTTNSRTWKVLPLLPAGTYKGMSICTTHDTRAGLYHVRSGGLKYTYVDFTNNANTPCYLDSSPIVRSLNAKGGDVGPAETMLSYSSNGPFVVLKSHGGIAHVFLNVNPTSDYHPASACDPTVASALRISFGSPSSFYLPLASSSMSVCQVFPSVFVGGVGTGRGKP